MIFKNNTPKSIDWWHKIFLIFSNVHNKNKRLTSVKKSDLFHTLFIFFKHKKNGVVALEIALTLPILLILIMGIIEFSIIFSIRSGIENITSNIQRSNSARFNFSQNYLEEELHRRLVNILPRPQNTTICVNTHKTLQNILNANGFTNCVRYSANRTINPTFIGLGTGGDYVEVKVTYKHKYLTPLGGLMNTLGNDLTFSSVAYIRREF